MTGHTGFKGCWLTLWLERLGAQVTGLSLEPATQPSLHGLVSSARRAEVVSHVIDLRDESAVKACVVAAKPDTIFHLAAQALVRPSYADPVATYATNVMGTVHLLEAVRATPSVRTCVVVTSDKAYENREWPWAYRETEAVGGHDPYSNSKGCAELVVSAYRKSFLAQQGVRLASARAGNVIGGGDWSADRLIPDLVRAFGRGESVEIRSPTAIRPWQHVLEPLSGYLLLAERLSASDDLADAWNFGPTDEDCRPVSHILDEVVRLWGPGARWHLSDKQNVHEATFLKVDASKARTYLGWQRRLDLNAALCWTIDWYRSQLDGQAAEALVRAQIEDYESRG